MHNKILNKILKVTWQNLKKNINNLANTKQKSIFIFFFIVI